MKIGITFTTFRSEEPTPVEKIDIFGWELFDYFCYVLISITSMAVRGADLGALSQYSEEVIKLVCHYYIISNSLTVNIYR